MIKRKELTDKIYKDILEIIKSGKIQEFLKFLSQFNQYSYLNKLLIFMINPNATRVAGLRTWNKYGYTIKKGEKAIRIVAPVVKKKKTVKKEKDPDGNEVKKVVEEDVIIGFKTVPVFDISQVKLVDPEKAKKANFWSKINGDAPSYTNIKTAIAKIVSAKIIDSDNTKSVWHPDIRGYASRDEDGNNYIHIDSTLSQADKLSVLFHEATHIFDKHLGEKHTPQQEIIAETSSAILMLKTGHEIPKSSLEYIAFYAQTTLDTETKKEEAMKKIYQNIKRGVEVGNKIYELIQNVLVTAVAA